MRFCEQHTLNLTPPFLPFADSAALSGGQKVRDALCCYRAIKNVRSLGYNTYRNLILSCLSARDVSAAMEVFQDLKASGRRPSQVLYCSLISAIGKQQKRGYRLSQVAYELWLELQSSAMGDGLDDVALRAGANIDSWRLLRFYSVLPKIALLTFFDLFLSTRLQV
jgi:pentatricopeptide repeat protein